MTESVISLLEQKKSIDSYEYTSLDCDPPSTKSLFNDPEVLEGRMTKAMTIILLIVAVMTICINTGVMVRLYRLRKKEIDFKPAFSFIGNLALSDFLIGLYIVVVFCIDLTQLSSEWRDGVCGLITAVAVTACEETICTISLIAIDKYIFICHGLSYRRIVTSKVVTGSIIVSWLISLLIGFMPAMGLHEDNWCACNFVLYISKAFAIILFMTAVVIPLIVITTLYAIILSLAIGVTRKKMDKSNTNSRGITTFRLTFVTKASKSSGGTVSSRLSTSGTSSSSNKLSTPATATNEESFKESKSKPEMESKPFKDKGTAETILGYKTSSLPIVYELQETDLMPYEIDSGDESDNEDSSDSASKSVIRSSSQFKRTKKEGSYDLIHPPKRTSGKGDAVEGSTSIYLRSYKQTDENGEAPSSQDFRSLEVQEQNHANYESIEESTSASENRQNSDSASSDRTIYFKRKASYFKKVIRETKDRVQFLQKCRAVKPIILILLCFTATYVPFVAGTLAFKVQSDKNPRLFKALNNLFYLAVVLNSVMNPFVYAYGYKEFRIKTKNFKGIFAKERKPPKPY